MAARVWGFQCANRCWCMRLHTMVAQTPLQSLHWKLTLGNKSPTASGNWSQVLLRPALLFDPMLYQLSCPNPFQGPATWTVLSSMVQEQNRLQKFIQFSSVQDGICVLEKAQTCTPPCISEVSALPLKQAQYSSDWQWQWPFLILFGGSQRSKVSYQCMLCLLILGRSVEKTHKQVSNCWGVIFRSGSL